MSNLNSPNTVKPESIVVVECFNEEFERYDDESTAKYVAKVINESKNKKEVLEKLKRLDIINKFKNEFGPIEMSAKEKNRW